MTTQICVSNMDMGQLRNAAIRQRNAERLSDARIGIMTLQLGLDEDGFMFDLEVIVDKNGVVHLSACEIIQLKEKIKFWENFFGKRRRKFLGIF